MKEKQLKYLLKNERRHYVMTTQNIIPLIDQLDITQEERELTIQKVNLIMKVHREKLFERSNLERLFSEWKTIADRVNKGGKMLDESFSMGKEKDSNHLRKLNDLYTLQLRLLGFYETVFKTALPTEAFDNTLNQIMRIASK